jgi:hypothetical protein
MPLGVLDSLQAFTAETSEDEEILTGSTGLTGKQQALKTD